MQETTWTTIRPRAGEGSGDFIERAWMTGNLTPEQIVNRVRRVWPNRKTTRHSVYFYRYRLVKRGAPNVPPWPRRHASRG